MARFSMNSKVHGTAKKISPLSTDCAYQKKFYFKVIETIILFSLKFLWKTLSNKEMVISCKFVNQATMKSWEDIKVEG